MKIGFTGTRQGMSQVQKDSLYRILEDYREAGEVEFHHGDCLGADDEAHDIAIQTHCSVVVHPPKIATFRAFRHEAGVKVLPPKDYFDRNHDIVDATDFLIAAPKTDHEELRSGTWATVRYADKKGKKVTLLGRE